MFSRGLIEGEAGKQESERSANVQTPQAPQTQTKTATRQQKKERKKNPLDGFGFHLREWNFVLKIPRKKGEEFRWKNVLMYMRMVFGIMMIIINKNTLWRGRKDISGELLLLIRFLLGFSFMRSAGNASHRKKGLLLLSKHPANAWEDLMKLLNVFT